MSNARKPTSERRTEIADAALRIIGTRGVSALTVSSLAKELGLTGGALYRHFASTEAILEAVAVRAEELLEASVPPADLPPLTWLERFAESRTATVGGHVGLARVLLSDDLSFVLPPAAVERLAAAVRRTRLALTRVLTEGQARGEIRDDVAAAQLAPIVMGTLQMIAMHRSGPMLPRVTGDPMQLLRTLLTVLAPSQKGGRK